ncbi:hypothetical protein K437DRAFT_587 [Tilletiaria anomala UBC 951]|uniref:Uncharacterized protein n=1 Tax=Tilletiaria anomala (strain ATCC 24038 / CBS 436.72 / UBC 951) TaxID=1037660 RepID=A0A066WLP4_TILAU|nr:uncharacterized protein K437DRAFT_587 [Tilletiaria anomala UBC 951]KDN53518.1 hypothetical protein K437DRAFT_587 [Tilletiaria anomala UBC 951]
MSTEASDCISPGCSMRPPAPRKGAATAERPTPMRSRFAAGESGEEAAVPAFGQSGPAMLHMMVTASFWMALVITIASVHIQITGKSRIVWVKSKRYFVTVDMSRCTPYSHLVEKPPRFCSTSSFSPRRPWRTSKLARRT